MAKARMIRYFFQQFVLYSFFMLNYDTDYLVTNIYVFLFKWLVINNYGFKWNVNYNLYDSFQYWSRISIVLVVINDF